MMHLQEGRSVKRCFIVGTQKSGTTWLRDCLNEFIPFCKPEWYYPDVWNTIREHVATYGASLSKELIDERAEQAARAAFDVLMAGYAGEKSAYPCSSAIGKIQIDLHASTVRLLKKHFSHAHIIVIVRDPRSVLNSLRHYLDHFRPGWSAEIDPTEFAKTWSVHNLQWFNDKPHSYVRFEDLKVNFEGSLARILSEMNIPVSHEEILELRAKFYDVDSLRERQPEIYRTGTTDEWRRLVPERDARAVEEIARPAMQALGMTHNQHLSDEEDHAPMKVSG